MNIFLSKLVASILLPITMLAGFLAPEVKQEPLGASLKIPTSIALFETTLASAITDTATSMTLTSATYNNGASTLASSTFSFIIDEGSSNQELVLADCTATACTNMTRGIDRLTGTTTVNALRYSHRRGASVKITDGPQLMILSRLVNGQDTLPNKLTYASVPTLTADADIATKKYADDLSFAGAPDATTGVKGIVELATAAEARAGTATGDTTASLVIPNSLATSSNDVATTHLVVTETDGKLNQNFLDLTESFTHTGAVTFNTATTTFNATTSIAATANTAPLRLNGVNYGFPSSIGASSTSLVVNSSGTLSWDFPRVAFIATSSASTLQLSSTAEQGTASGSYVKLKEVQVYYGGNMQIDFQIKTDNGSFQANGRIYKNGVAFGTEQTTTSTNYVTKSETNLSVSTGDRLQLYAYCAGGHTCTVTNFKFYFDLTATTTTGYVLID